MTTDLATLDDDEEDHRVALNYPTREEQQRENKSWQDVYDLPARKYSESQQLLHEVREASPRPMDRLDAAERLKEEANAAFGRGEHQVALRSYLLGLWLLDLDDPPAPKALSEASEPSGVALIRMLSYSTSPPTSSAERGVSSGDEPKIGDNESVRSTPANDAEADATSDTQAASAADDGEGAAALATSNASAEEAGALAALRQTLRLNVAAATLKIEEWGAAKFATELVLACDPTHPKGLYRLAQAHAGAGDLSAALSVLTARLLKHEPGHAEGARLAKSLKARLGQERRMFGGLFDRAQGDGGETSGLYSDAALREEARARKEERDKLLKIENVAKLPTEMWAETMKEAALNDTKMAQLADENRELSQDMDDGARALVGVRVRARARARVRVCGGDARARARTAFSASASAASFSASMPLSLTGAGAGARARRLLAEALGKHDPREARRVQGGS